MQKGKSLIFVPLLLAVSSCGEKKEQVVPETKPPVATDAPRSSPADSSAVTPADDEGPAASSKLADRSAVPPSKPPVAERIPGTSLVKSPFSDAQIDVQGLAPGQIAKDPASGKNFTIPEAAKPAHPTAKAVPGTAGKVFSPYNNNVIDVAGIPAGRIVADPNYPANEKKYFVVPEMSSAPNEAKEEPKAVE